MIVRVFLVVILLFSVNGANANEQRIKALEFQLDNVTADNTSRLPVLLELAELYLYEAPQNAKQYALHALPLSTQLQDDYSRTRTLWLLGMASIYQGENNEAFTNLTKSISAAKSTLDPHLLSITHRSLGVYYELTLDFDNAVRFYIEAIRYAKQSNIITDLAMVYNNLGNVLISQGDFEEAESYFLRSAALFRRANNFDKEMNVMVGLGVSYLKMQKFEEARRLFETVLANEDAIYDFTYSEASVNLAHVFQALGLHDDAKEMYNHVITDTRAGAYPQALASAYLGLAKLYTNDEEYGEALSLYRQGIVEVKNKTSVESEIELYENLAKLELKLGYFQDAATTQAEYIARRNKIQPVTQAGIIKKLEGQLQAERDLIDLQETLLQREREAQHSSLFLFTSVVISLICLVLFLSLRLRQQKLMRLEQTNESLVIESETDPLTGIGNRRYLDRKLASMQGESISTAFLLIDVDHFKELNDSYGHDTGDEVLIGLANMLKSLCRKDDIVARIGGEEFVILLFNTTDDASLEFAERIRKTVEKQVFKSRSSVTVSIGVASGTMDCANYDKFYKQADIALYNAKSDGRNHVREYVTEEGLNPQIQY
ncbi:hypothetical protein D210916BOD24_33500 [Alteromonas sp. D210916BOD_24]|uniref:GGDEF domain-containing protein n=1 Tax=Alteromonas sp. D210916BOD_24 TaxID=3157618 RepID=UPI00399CB25F